MFTVVEIRTGGQSGADRGAFDAARDMGVPISGWCPIGGWAEDYPDAPGLLADYPEMIECDSELPIRRTELNIRDSSACVVMNANAPVSPGTDNGMSFFDDYGVPYCYFNLDVASTPSGFESEMDKVFEWLDELPDDGNFVLGVGGPRASEYDGVYDISYDMTSVILREYR